MELIFEFIAELLFDTTVDGAVSAAGNRKIPRPVRFLILMVLILLFAFVMFAVFLAGALMIRDGKYAGGIIILAIGAFMLVMSVIKFRSLREKVRKSPDEGENKGEEL
ncbi:MAG: hypothetical protein IKO47_06640 [Ruminococcus sp.]|nr:hypothetical protein [Ruminococcus sp.]